MAAELQTDGRLISPGDVGRILGFSARTIKRMAHRGELLGTVFIASHVRFKLEVITAFVERGGAVQAGGGEK